MKCFGLLYQRLPVQWDSHALNRCQLFNPLACKRQKQAMQPPCSALLHPHPPGPGQAELPVSTELLET